MSGVLVVVLRGWQFDHPIVMFLALMYIGLFPVWLIYVGMADDGGYHDPRTTRRWRWLDRSVRVGFVVALVLFVFLAATGVRELPH